MPSADVMFGTPVAAACSAAQAAGAAYVWVCYAGASKEKAMKTVRLPPLRLCSMGSAYATLDG